MTLEIELVRNEDDFKEARRIRKKVFVNEQGIPVSCEVDGKDEESTHLIAKLNKEPIGTARIRITDNKAKLERISVLKPYRKRGFGKELVKKSIDYCKKEGVSKIFLHSQIYLQAFYEKIGFKPIGEPFSEAGVEHIKMVLFSPKEE